ncbi:DNA repair protein RadA [Anaerolentibacter hominis]|uniref:DNA repair protein RadA n=1 Tax=Anaerolentibacter hominis TaxID=3079009 RepID=UPI0031B7FDEA
MAKAKTVFFCKECGYESAKWLGQCPGCRQWNTFVEEPGASKGGKPLTSGRREKAKPEKLSAIHMGEEERLHTGIGELDRVLGGGVVQGSLVLVGGDPGIGKSTLLLMMCKKMVEKGIPVLYVSGEESLRQIKMRAERLGDFGAELLLLCETDLDVIEGALDNIKPSVLIIDSIQTMMKEDVASAPGSVSQVRECTGQLMRIAKQKGISTFIVGHVTKEGTVAGPRMLEHMVDTVLYFEGENRASYRILRGVKNRFGSTNEIGVFEMRSDGLAEITNPSAYMLQGRPEGESGSVVACSLEGTRPILVEVQALICQTNFNMPRRTAAGTDYNRVNLLLAVLEKRLGLQLSACDAYVNVAGGMRINEPALDLSLIMAVLSSYYNKPLESSTISFGEVGLTGEIRAVNMAAQRVAEAEKMGYEVCLLPAGNVAGILQVRKPKIKLLGLHHIREAVDFMQSQRMPSLEELFEQDGNK